MNKAIIHHKVAIKCNICGKDMLVDHRLVDSGKGVHMHMACAMESTGRVYTGAHAVRLEEYRRARNANVSAE